LICECSENEYFWWLLESNDRFLHFLLERRAHSKEIQQKGENLLEEDNSQKKTAREILDFFLLYRKVRKTREGL